MMTNDNLKLVFCLLSQEKYLSEYRLCPCSDHNRKSEHIECSACNQPSCHRLKELGLDKKGKPLPYAERPLCGANTRSGGSCGKPVIPGKRRCRFHGGLSTGPKTVAGRQRIREAQQRRWKKAKELALIDSNATNDSSAPQLLEECQIDENRIAERKYWRRRKRVSGMAV